MTTSQPLPSPTELAPEIASVTRLLDGAADAELDDAALEAELAARVRAVAREEGSGSLAHVQAELQAALALCERSRCDLALGFLATRLARTEALLGSEHRETAMALADLAVARREASDDPDAPDAEAEDLLRRALDVRRRVLGEVHEETAGSELFLAEELLRERRRTPASIHEAKQLAARALATLESSRELPDPALIDAIEASGRVALLEGDPARAEALLRRIAGLPDDDLLLLALTQDARRLYADALRGLGRSEEAARFDLATERAMQDTARKFLEEGLSESEP